MPTLKMEKFGGMLPAWGAQLLPDGQAANAKNAYLFSGELIGWRKPKLLRYLNSSTTKAVFRIPTGTDDTILAASTWMEFDDHETTVVRSTVVDDSFKRYYWASPSDVPRYNTQARIEAANPAFKLGLNPPGCAPIVTPTNGGNQAQEGYPKPTLVGTAAVTVPANYIFLVPFTPAGAEEIDDIAFVPASDALTGRVQGVVYEDNSGSPGNLLAYSIAVQGVQSGTQVTLNFRYPFGCLKGVQYWIGFITDSAIDVAASDDLGTHGYQIAQPYSSGPKANAAGGAGSLVTPQLWADMTTSAVLEARAYVYTWVSAYGEESAPSPATIVTGWTNADWTIDLYSPDPLDEGTDRYITLVRLYRTIPSVGGQTGYFLVTELAVGTASYLDILTSDVVALNSQLETNEWFPPPVDLQMIITMPNGMMVGFRENELWFCEPYRPHAWPPGYVLTTEFPIVGLGVSGQSLVACTTSMPYLANGPSPAAMSLLKIPVPEPCISRGSIIGRDDGVYYCSPYGLIRVDAAGRVANITESWVTREKWAQLTPPRFTHAVQLSSLYLAFGVAVDGDTTYAQEGFNIEMNDDSGSFSIWPQPGHHRMGFMPMTSPLAFDIENFFTDPWSGVACFIMNDAVYYYDFSDTSPDLTTYLWRSKQYQQVAKQNFAAIKVFFTVPVNTPAQGTRNVAATADSSWNTLATNQYGILRVYADDVLVTTREIVSSGEVLRILSDFKADVWEFEIEARVRIKNVQIATSVKELARV